MTFFTKKSLLVVFFILITNIASAAIDVKKDPYFIVLFSDIVIKADATTQTFTATVIQPKIFYTSDRPWRTSGVVTEQELVTAWHDNLKVFGPHAHPNGKWILDTKVGKEYLHIILQDIRNEKEGLTFQFKFAQPASPNFPKDLKNHAKNSILSFSFP